MSKISVNLQSVANFFIHKSNSDDKIITNKKLQKLVYYAQAWNLVFTGGVLFSDQIEAWMHGPAVHGLWKKYSKYGYQPILEKPLKPKYSNDEDLLLEEIWRVYGKHDADYLEALTHSEMPWQEARKGLDRSELSSIIIDTNIMKVFYAKLNEQKIT